jgi:hypothetical protein
MRTSQAAVALWCLLWLGAAAALFLSGCGGDQARAAANSNACILEAAKRGPLNEDQAALLGGAMSEGQAIINSTEPGTKPTIDTTAPPAEMAAQERAHAQTVRTIGQQAADSTWTWVLGAIATGASLLLGGGVGGLLAKRGAGSLLRTAVEFGSAALDALKQSNLPAAKAVIDAQVAEQEARGQREAIRAVVNSATPDNSAVERAARLKAEAQLAVVERAALRLSVEYRRLYAEHESWREQRLDYPASNDDVTNADPLDPPVTPVVLG